MTKHRTSHFQRGPTSNLLNVVLRRFSSVTVRHVIVMLMDQEKIKVIPQSVNRKFANFYDLSANHKYAKF
jgi:hypothetical protein